jgi:eukaryotic-like serine/threonine-protein kinase
LSQHDVTLLAKRETSGAADSAGGQTTEFASLDPQIHRASYTRLAWAAFSYATAYLAAFCMGWILEALHGGPPPPARESTIAAVSILFGFSVFVLCLRRSIPIRLLPRAVFLFQILGAVGINAGFWGWEGNITPDFHFSGIPWVCLWILIFPSVIPAAPRRTLAAALIAASTGPIITALSPMVNGSPEWLTPGAAANLIANIFYPAFIAAGLAHWTAVLVFKLSREASQARRMGSYQLVDRIGAGGMGEVWKAKHRLLVRPAAIKLIRPESLGRSEVERRTALKRFEREAQATALLRSPHTVELYDFGVTDDGTFYYVMEMLDGLDLKRLVERYGPVPAERAVHILRQACHSLDDAHTAGMVHRDIKPANVFACRRGRDYDFVKVLDFGLVAAHAESDEISRTQLTADGVVSGTPAFMAPEMASGERATDPRADIYALGCVGYWLLTGKVVFEGPSPMAVLLKHMNDLPRPPSTRTELPVPPDLERVILACLAKDPDARPASAEALARALERCAGAGGWTNENAAAWWRRHQPQTVATREDAAHRPARSGDVAALAPR